MEDRRKADRVKVNLTVKWEGSLATLRGEITDLSTNGCFILSEDKVTLGELIKVEIPYPRSGSLCIQAKVIYQMPEIGFGVCFTGAEESEMKRLRWLVKAELYRAGE